MGELAPNASSTTEPHAADFLAQARALIGPAQVLTESLDAWAVDWRAKFRGRALAVLRPGSTAEVSACVALCAQHGVAVVPQGGNTGMCGGATPDASGTQVVLSLARLNHIRAIDPLDNTLTAEAGCVLQTLQQAAAEAGRLFPLSLGAEGSCQIGGNLATNAGGVNVLRYGNARDLVLGLEVVLPDGRVLNLMRALRKDNTGYDLKNLFIGAEGTLGIITAAVLKLHPAARASVVAWAAVPSPQHALQMLAQLRARLGERINAFELMSDASVELVRDHFPATPQLLAEPSPWYVLCEVADGSEPEALQAAVEAALEAALDGGALTDVAVAASGAQSRAIWDVRHHIVEAQQNDGANIKHDIAVPVSRVPAFIAEGVALLHAAYEGVRPIVYGHLGDGNLHFNVSRPLRVTDNREWLRESEAVNRLVHDAVARFEGSISAEHGLGQLKRDENIHYKDPLAIELMQRIKAALDPRGLMNPDKVLPR